MSIKYLETKSETGRSGLRVEFDATTDIVKLSGFYDTYVKLHLKKNEWKLQDFLEYLGITDILEKKNNTISKTYGNEHMEEIKVSGKKKSSSSKSKTNASEESNQLRNLSNLTKETLEFDNLPKVQLSYILKKTTSNPRIGSIQVNLSIGSDRTRFIIPNRSRFSMSLWLSDKKLFDVKHKDYSSLYNAISQSINQFKIALEVKSKEIEGLKKEKKGKINKSMLEPNNLLKYILARVKVSG